MLKNIILILLVILIAVFPLVTVKDSEFSGTDGEAEGLIGEINPTYEPWFNSFWEPPSGEIESLLFALQAALGAGFIGYYIGYKRGEKTKENKADKGFMHADDH